jgi:hypothetical protein
MSGCGFGTHYFVLAQEIEVNYALNKMPKEQYGYYEVVYRKETITKNVHKHTKWYF